MPSCWTSRPAATPGSWPATTSPAERTRPVTDDRRPATDDRESSPGDGAAMTVWSGVAEAYRRSFATLCAGTIDTLLEDTAASPGGDGPTTSGRPRHLDVGGGTGRLALAAAQRGRDVVAADVDPDMAALARDTADGSGRADQAQEGTVSVLEAGSPTLPCPDASFDAITANFVINHVPDPRATMQDLVRLAAPSARVALTIWPAAPAPHLVSYGEAARLDRKSVV